MTTTIPTTADELEEMIGDGRVTAMFEGGKAKPEFGTFIKNYAQALQNKDSEIGQQVRDETQRVLAQWLKDNQAEGIKRVNLDPETAPNNKYAARYNKNAAGAKADKLFDGSADFFASIWHRATSPEAHAKQADLRKIRNDYGTAVPADGGFLVPESLRAELLRVSLETAVVRPRARVIPMDSETVPFPAIDDTSHASNVYGGLTAYWTEESGQLTESQATFRRIKLEAKKLTAYSEIPNELFAASIVSFEALVNQIYPEALAWFEDNAFTRGTGVGEPLGYLNSNAAVSVTKESGQVAATIVWENIVKMYSRMLPSSLARAVWVCHIDTFPELATMALSVGTGGGPIWLNNGVEGPPMTILGRPVIFTEKAESVGTAGDINFVDFGYYLIGDRQIMQAETSPHFKFQNDQTAVRFIQRLDGRPWLESALTPLKGSNTLSPFVKIATRA
jgi:HK97 family phage major capsid protein